MTRKRWQAGICPDALAQGRIGGKGSLYTVHLPATFPCPLFSDRQHLELWCLSGSKTADYQNCSVLYCVLELRTVISTLRRAVLTVLWIGFCHTGPISLCVDLFIRLYLCVFMLHSCHSIMSAVGWTWWDWSLILRTYLPSVLWHCWLGHLTRKNPSPIWPIMCLVGR